MEIFTFQELSDKHRACVYFLMRESKVVYVGQSSNIQNRKNGHSDKDFTSIVVFPCDDEQKRLLNERCFIELLSPEYNAQHNHEDRPAVTRSGIKANGREPLTQRQMDVLEFIVEQYKAGQTPSVREIADRFGIRSPNGVVCHLDALISKGYIKRSQRKARSIVPVL